MSFSLGKDCLIHFYLQVLSKEIKSWWKDSTMHTENVKRGKRRQCMWIYPSFSGGDKSNAGDQTYLLRCHETKENLRHKGLSILVWGFGFDYPRKKSQSLFWSFLFRISFLTCHGFIPQTFSSH